MDMRRNSNGAGGKKMWYCLELFDEEREYHGFTASYTTERDGAELLHEADRLAPPTMHIYYWRQDDKPIVLPPEGYTEGPLAKPQK